MYGKGLRTLSILTAVTLTAAFALGFFYAPMDADQGVMQKIFYLHVPMAIVALLGFVAGGIFAIQHLRSGDRKHDLRSYVAIHMSLILGIGVLVTGSIWAKAAWGHWWLWDEPALVSFLIVFLLYACYQPLRFAIEDPERQARYASVFAIIAGAFVPLNFMAVRMAQEKTHPRVLQDSDNLPGEVWLVFFVALLGMGLLFVTLWRFEMAAKNTRGQIRKLRRRLGQDVIGDPIGGPPMILAEVLPENSDYVFAAYLVFFALLLVYFVIMAFRLARIERELVELNTEWPQAEDAPSE